MHNNYFFLRTLTPFIESRFKGTVVSECFSQNKDELVVRLEAGSDSLFIKGTFGSSFSCLSFPEVFHRARRNSVDLFEEIIGRRITGVRQFNNERSFAIHLTDGYSLLFKMHGNRSNCLVLENETVSGLFNQSIDTDLTLNPSTLDRQIDWSFDAFLKNISRIESHYFTFGKIVWKYLDAHGFREHSPEEKWTSIQEVLRLLENPTYYIVQLDKIALSLLPISPVRQTFSGPAEALNQFFSAYTQAEGLSAERNLALSRLKSSLRSSENHYNKSLHRLESLESTNNYKVWADLIMANLHAIPEKAKEVTLQNFYDENNTVVVPLRENLSPQKNAEIYYSKAKKQQVEVSMLKEAISKKEHEIGVLKEQLQELGSIHDIKALRSFVSALGLKVKVQEAEPLPYHQFEFNGYMILVGKNAQSNDKLTFRHGFKEDLWLHAKDVAGSHVLIKYQSGKKIPKDVIERAAQLAAYYSKRKNETLCPVVVTPRKFIRKRKGDPAGMVVVEKEETILVEPKGGKENK